MNRRWQVMLRSPACSGTKNLWHECDVRSVPETMMTPGYVTPYPTRTHPSQPSVHGRASGAWAHFALCRRHVATLALSARVETI
jgi:hypothetical protein